MQNIPKEGAAKPARSLAAGLLRPMGHKQGGRKSMKAKKPDMTSSYALQWKLGYPADFIARLSDAITQAQTKKQSGALFILSIDNLAMIISGYGHEVCEQMMTQIEHEVADIIGSEDVIQRIQRDQFGIILHQLKDSEARYLAERIVSHIRQYGQLSPNGTLHVMGTIASVSFPDQAKTAEEALDYSFIAMRDGSPENTVHLFNINDDRSAFSRQEMGLANYLSKAIIEKRLKMAYQPIIQAKTGEISHYEALLRLYSDDGKITSAGALIPIAERMGLIDIIDETTLQLVVEELRRDPNVNMAFNVSNITTRSSHWLERFTEAVQETPSIGPRMIVEITETAAQRDLRQTAFFIAEIQALGAQVALDDFGSGYTSFRQLKTLSVDMVKIDGAFVRDIVDNYDNRLFVKTLLEFTNAFGLKSVAEYVENGEIAKMLMELGVEYLQGYYFGRPENHRSWLKNGEYERE